MNGGNGAAPLGATRSVMRVCLPAPAPAGAGACSLLRRRRKQSQEEEGREDSGAKESFHVRHGRKVQDQVHAGGTKKCTDLGIAAAALPVGVRLSY